MFGTGLDFDRVVFVSLEGEKGGKVGISTCGIEKGEDEKRRDGEQSDNRTGNQGIMQSSADTNLYQHTSSSFRTIDFPPPPPIPHLKN